MIRKIVFVLAVTAPLAACLLDLPTPTINDDAGLDGSTAPDTGLPDGYMPPDGTTMGDSGGDGMMMGTDGGCDSGAVCPFATFNSIEPRLIDTDDASVYFALGADTIKSINIGTSASNTLVSGMNDNINDLKVRGTSVYFVSKAQIAARVPVNGGSRLTYTNAGSAITSIDADSSYVWFTLDAVSGGGIVRCSAMSACGNINPLLAFTSPRHLLVDGAVAYWDTDAQNIYFCQTPQCSSGTSGTGFGVTNIGFDTNAVYWVDNSSIYRESKGQTSAVPVVSSSNGGANGFAVRADTTNMYWLTKSGNVGALRRCKISTGCMSNMADTLASNLNNPTSLTLTGSEVFFTTQGDNTIWRVPK